VRYLTNRRAQRARVWVLCSEPIGVPISGHEGNPKASCFTDYGCPVLSSGEDGLFEMMFIKCKAEVLDWLQQVALEEEYCNPVIVTDFSDKVEQADVPWPGEE
jgi:hypothetical protein